MHGARVIALRGNFDEALELVRELAAAPPDRARELGQPVPPRRARRPRRSRSSTRSARSTRSCIPVGNAGNITAYWKGFPEAGAAPRMLGFQAEGAAPLVHGAAGRAARRRSRARSGSATRRAGRRRWRAMTSLARRDPRRLRRRDPRRLPAARRARGRLLRAGVAPRRWRGCSKYGADDAERIVCVLTGHGLKDPQTALDAGRLGRPVRARDRRGRGGRARLMQRRRLRPRAGVLGQPRARLRRARRRARAAHGGRGGGDRALRGRHRPRHRARPAQPRRARRSRRCTRPTTSSSASAPTIPLSGGLGTSAAALVAGPDGRRLAVRARRRPARPRHRARGPPGQRRRRAARRLRDLRRRPRHALRDARRARGRARRAARVACARREARAALPRQVPMADAVFNVAHASLLVLGLADGRPRARRPRARRPPAPAAPRAPLPASRWSSRPARRELGALGATISGAGPTVLVWTQYESTGPSCAAWRRSPTAGPRCGGSASSRRARTSRSCSGPDVRRRPLRKHSGPETGGRRPSPETVTRHGRARALAGQPSRGRRPARPAAARGPAL